MEENAVFEINDFTIVTEMEHFYATFEGIIQKYELLNKKYQLSNDEHFLMTVSDSTDIFFGANKLTVEFQQPKVVSSKKKSSENTPVYNNVDDTSASSFVALEEIKNTKNGFYNNDGLSLRFGVKACIVIYPCDSSCALIDETQANTVLGMVKSVMHSTRCEIPVFCYIKNKSLSIIEGYASDGNSAINFSSVVLQNINRRHCNLSNLMYLFKEHLGVSNSAFHDEVRVNCRLTHVLPIKSQNYFRLHTLNNFLNLASGPVSCLPFEAFEIAATWNSFRENSLTENHNHTDFDICHSSNWKVKAKPVTQSLLGIFDEILGVYSDNKRKLIKTDIKCKQILGKHYIHKELPHAFQNLTVNYASEVKLIDSKHQNDERTNGPLVPSMIKAWVSFIFGEESGKNRLSRELDALNVLMKHLPADDPETNENLSQKFSCLTNENGSDTFLAEYKSAKKGTTAWKLAVALANSRILMIDEPRTEPQLWIEFLLELRQKYDKLETVENISTGIDNAQCLFSQKMQMLQICIEAKKKRHTLFEKTQDEFFDVKETFTKGGIVNKEKKSFGEGRLKKSEMMLVGSPNESMFIPITQDACPLTDDMIDIRNNYLLSLKEEERINIQMELVKSDMQSFKAANPGSVFADFLRWHSPKDYDETSGKISDRMQTPKNIWVESWNAALPVPVVHQARIFNDTKIAEEIFEEFENATLDQVRNWMKATVFAATLERLTEVESVYGISEEKMKQRKATAKKLANATLNHCVNDYNEIAKYCSQVEMIHNMKVHLTDLFIIAKEKMQPPFPTEAEVQNAIRLLVNLAVCNIWETSEETETVLTVKPQEPIARAIAIMSCLDQMSRDQMVNWKRKEYILYWNLKHPSTTTLLMSHRMYADLNPTQHSLYFAVSNDTNFFNTSHF